MFIVASKDWWTFCSVSSSVRATHEDGAIDWERHTEAVLRLRIGPGWITDGGFARTLVCVIRERTSVTIGFANYLMVFPELVLCLNFSISLDFVSTHNCCTFTWAPTLRANKRLKSQLGKTLFWVFWFYYSVVNLCLLWLSVWTKFGCVSNVWIGSYALKWFNEREEKKGNKRQKETSFNKCKGLLTIFVLWSSCEEKCNG